MAALTRRENRRNLRIQIRKFLKTIGKLFDRVIRSFCDLHLLWLVMDFGDMSDEAGNNKVIANLDDECVIMDTPTILICKLGV